MLSTFRTFRYTVQSDRQCSQCPLSHASGCLFRVSCREFITFSWTAVQMCASYEALVWVAVIWCSGYWFHPLALRLLDLTGPKIVYHHHPHHLKGLSLLLHSILEHESSLRIMSSSFDSSRLPFCCKNPLGWPRFASLGQVVYYG
jgi:hypothetical protein